MNVNDEIETENSLASSVERLIASLTKLRLSLLKYETDFRSHLLQAHPAFRKSAVNLIHYLALRQHDIRSLQDQLAALGLSSLGRTEAHVMSTLDAVIEALLRMAGRQREKVEQLSFPDFQEGRSLLKAHTDALLGEAPAHRSVRVMVTMSTEAAEDYAMVRALLAQGMNCMRVNCAHDTPEIWERMINHVRRAQRELGLPCRVLMDLAGPKLRTGSIEPGPRVVVWHPRRDALGHVTDAARILLVSAESRGTDPPDADAVLPVDTDWLAQVRPGERIHFKDARGKRRVLEVIGNSEHGRWARCDQTAYVTPDTVLLRVDVAGESGREGGASVRCRPSNAACFCGRAISLCLPAINPTVVTRE